MVTFQLQLGYSTSARSTIQYRTLRTHSFDLETDGFVLEFHNATDASALFMQCSCNSAKADRFRKVSLFWQQTVSDSPRTTMVHDSIKRNNIVYINSITNF